MNRRALLALLLAFSALALPGHAFGQTFVSSGLFTTGVHPDAIAVGHFNGDGNLDVVVANFGENSISVLLGNGAGGLGAKTDFPTGVHPEAIAAKDLNSDLDFDVVTVNYDASTISVLLATGGGNFSAPATYHVGTHPMSVAIGDLNHDSKNDLVVSDYDSSAVTVWFGNGAGGFVSRADFATGSNPEGVAIGDMNGDGNPDLVVASFTPGSVSVLRGNGSGGFTPQLVTPVPGGPFAVAIGDLNRDGFQDVVVTNYSANAVSFLPGLGTGGFGARVETAVGVQPTSVVIDDLDGACFEDVVVTNSGSNTVTVLSGNGAGGLPRRTDYATGSGPTALAVGDLDRDDRDDLAIADYFAGKVTVLVAKLPPCGGVPVCTAPGNQNAPSITPDGSGGAFLAWEDQRGASSDIYAQRLDHAGVPQWATNGVAISTAPADEYFPAIVSDLAGGAIVAWHETGSPYGVRMQRLDAAGAPVWVSSVSISTTASGPSLVLGLIPDGGGGAIVTWADGRNGNPDIYAQRVDLSGTKLWTTVGKAVCTATGNQIYPSMVTDNNGGAIIAWDDARGATRQIFAQRMSSAGVAQWTADGVALTTGAGDKVVPHLTPDAVHGAIAVWSDYRSGDDVYAQRVRSTGTPLWGASGVSVGSAGGSRVDAQVVPDRAGGAIVVWTDQSGAHTQVYGQRLDSLGTRQWGPDGTPVASNPTPQSFPSLVSEPGGGAVFAWADRRNCGIDAYAQRLDGSGVAQWNPSGVALCGGAAGLIEIPVLANDAIGDAFAAWSDGLFEGADIFAARVDGSGSEVVSVPRGLTPDPITARAWPNPFVSMTSIDFDLPARSAVLLEVLDASGRRVWETPATGLEPGRHTLAWNGQTDSGAAARPGVYYLHVAGSSFEATRSVVRLR